MSERITDIKLQTRYIQKAFRASELRQISWDISHWLKPSDPTTNLKKALDERHTGTCRWFHDSELYQSWKSKQNSFLWLHGLSGCGKTILASSIIDRISAEDDDSLLLLFFYFDFSDNTKQSLEQMLRTLLGQLYSQSDIAKRYLKGLYVRCRDGTRAPNIAEMCTALNDMAGQLPDVVMVVEAVDESHERENVVSWINDIHAAGFSSLHMLVTSRMEGSLSMTVTQWPQQDEILAIENDKVNADIRNYIHSRLHEGREFDKWDRQQGLHEEVESKVLEKSDGM